MTRSREQRSARRQQDEDGDVVTVPSFAPATTPDVRLQPPPLRGSDISAALAASSSSSGSALRQRHHSQRSQVTTTGGALKDPTQHSGHSDAINLGMLRWGYGLLTFSITAFIVLFWSIAVAPFMPTKGIPVLDTLANDKHYKYLIVFLVPVTLYAVIINWWGLKIFRHA